MNTNPPQGVAGSRGALTTRTTTGANTANASTQTIPQTTLTYYQPQAMIGSMIFNNNFINPGTYNVTLGFDFGVSSPQAQTQPRPKVPALTNRGNTSAMFHHMK